MNHYPKLKTHKLFYGKYPYKVTTHIQGCSLFRYHTIDQVISMGIQKHISVRERCSPADLLEYSRSLKSLETIDYKTRIEGSTLSVFLKDKTDYDLAVKTLKKYISNVTEPEDDVVLQTIAGNKKIVVCKDLPYGKYTHKITFRQMPQNVRTNIYEWIKKYTADDIGLRGQTESYLAGNKQWCFDPFIYVADGKMLMMLGLAADGYIRKTEEFIPKSSINTSS